MFLRSPYNYDTNDASASAGVSFVDYPTLAQQHMRDECDINVMVSRFARTGMPDAPDNIPSMAVFDEVFDFQSAMNAVVQGREAFAALPSDVRTRFANDPGRFLDFVNDESNRAEAERLGLLKPVIPPIGPEPDESGVVNPSKVDADAD